MAKFLISTERRRYCLSSNVLEEKKYCFQKDLILYLFTDEYSIKMVYTYENISLLYSKKLISGFAACEVDLWGNSMMIWINLGDVLASFNLQCFVDLLTRRQRASHFINKAGSSLA